MWLQYKHCLTHSSRMLNNLVHQNIRVRDCVIAGYFVRIFHGSLFLQQLYFSCLLQFFELGFVAVFRSSVGVFFKAVT